jgi:hypothetical protein
MPAPTTAAEAVALIASAVDPLREGFAWFEANGPHAHEILRLHGELTKIADRLEIATGVPYGTFGGGGGTPKGPH